MLVLYINQYFSLPIDFFLHQKFSSHLATVPRMPQAAGGRGWEGGSALAAKPSSCRTKQIHCSTWPSEFSKLGFLRKCCLCSHGVFLCVPVHFDLSISFFQRNFKTSNTEIPWKTIPAPGAGEQLLRGKHVPIWALGKWPGRQRGQTACTHCGER